MIFIGFLLDRGDQIANVFDAIEFTAAVSDADWRRVATAFNAGVPGCFADRNNRRDRRICVRLTDDLVKFQESGFG